MKPYFEWPLLGPAEGAGGDEHAAAGVLRFYDHVALIRASDAVEAFARRRAGQIVHKGHTLESDLGKAPGVIARQAKGSLSTFLDIIGPYRMNMPPQRRTECLRAIESAGANLIALWERLQIEVDEE